MDTQRLKFIAELCHDDIVDIAFSLNFASCDLRLNHQFFVAVFVVLKLRLGQAVLECIDKQETR